MCSANTRLVVQSKLVNGSGLHTNDASCCACCAVLPSAISSQEATTMATLRHPCCVQFLVCLGFAPNC